MIYSLQDIRFFLFCAFTCQTLIVLSARLLTATQHPIEISAAAFACSVCAAFLILRRLANIHGGDAPAILLCKFGAAILCVGAVLLIATGPFVPGALSAVVGWWIGLLGTSALAISVLTAIGWSRFVAAVKAIQRLWRVVVVIAAARIAVGLLAVFFDVPLSQAYGANDPFLTAGVLSTAPVAFALGLWWHFNRRGHETADDVAPAVLLGVLVLGAWGLTAMRPLLGL